MSESDPRTVDETLAVSLDKLAETSPVAITKVDRKGKIVYANSKAEEVLGLRKSEITDRTYDDVDWKITYYDGTDYPSDELPFEIVKETEEPVESIRHAIEWPDGERKLLSINASPLFDDDGNFDGIVSVIEDVTEQTSLQQREDHLTSLLKSIRDVNQLLVKENDRDKLIEEICDILIETRGYYNVWVALLGTEEQLITASQKGLGDSFGPMLERLEAGNLPAITRQALDQPGVIVTTDPRATCDDCPLSDNYEDRGALTARLAYRDTVYGVISASTPLKYAEDEEEQSLFEEVAGDIGFGLHNVDVEKDLRKREAQLKRSQQLAKVGSWRLDLETGRLDWSEETCRIFEVSTDDRLSYKEFLEFIHPEDRDYVDEEWNEALENDKEYEVEHRIVVDGSTKWVKEKAEVARNQQGKPREVVGSVQDITERKQAEEKLKESEQRYQSYFEELSDAIFVLAMGGDDHGKILDVNSAAVEQTGFSRDELIGMNMIEDLALSPPPDMDYEKANSMLSRGETVSFAEKKQKKDGTEYWTEVVVTPIEYEGRQANLSINRDITERKEAEEELRKSKKRFRDLANLLPQPIWETDEDGVFTYTNEASYEKFGYAPKDMEEGISITDVVAPEEREKMRRNFAVALEGEELTDHEYTCATIDGEKFPALIYGSPITHDGEVEGLRGITLDITRRKRMQDKLEDKVEFERLLRKLSGRFLSNPEGELDEVINDGLAQIGEFLGIDRTYLFQFDWEKEEMNNTHEWCCEGIEPQRENLQDIPNSSLPAWMDKLQSLENINIPSVPDLPEEWKPEQEILEAQNIQSLIVVPISYRGNLLGFAGFDSVREKREWGEEEEDLLRVFGDLTGSALHLRDTETQLRTSEEELRQSFIELAETTSRVLGVRDPYTQKHEQRVAELAREVGERMGLGEEKLLGLYIGGVLHDIGKIVVPETILTKPGELKDVEWDMIRSHPEVGYNQILKDTDFPWPVAEMTLHHHERLDGSGYPHGLEGEELTEEVRILGAVDVVEAMSTRRPYREARSKERTLNVLKEGKGDKFDSEVVDILVELIEEGEIEFGEE